MPLQQALQCEEKMVVGGFSFLRSVLLVLIVYSCCIAAAAAAVATDPQVPAVIIFGDSTSDVGMNTFLSTLVRSDFAPYGENFEGGKATGRFTNGYMINDFIGKHCSGTLLFLCFFLCFPSEIRLIRTGMECD